MKYAATIVGAIVAATVHGGLGAAYYVYQQDRVQLDIALKSERGRRGKASLCDGRRCPRHGRRMRRRKPVVPEFLEPQILEAMVIPALGMVKPVGLPQIETYEQPEIFEDGVNLKEAPSDLKKLIKEEEAKASRRDRTAKNERLSDLLDDHRNNDPRARAKSLENITGQRSGEIGGQGMERRLGSVYSARAARAIRKVFKTPPFIDEATMKTLSARIQVTRLGHDGAVLSYRVLRKSGDGSFDSAALSAIKQFVPAEGGGRRLPAPEPEVLRYINAKGMLIKLEGRLMKR